MINIEFISGMKQPTEVNLHLDYSDWLELMCGLQYLIDDDNEVNAKEELTNFLDSIRQARIEHKNIYTDSED